MEDIKKITLVIKKSIIIIWKVLTLQYITYSVYTAVYEFDKKYKFIQPTLLWIVIFMLLIGAQSKEIYFALGICIIAMILLYIWFMMSYSREVILNYNDEIDSYRWKKFKRQFILCLMVIINFIIISSKIFKYYYNYSLTETNEFNLMFLMLLISVICILLYRKFIKDGNVMIQYFGLLASSLLGLAVIITLFFQIIQTISQGDDYTNIIKYMFPTILFCIHFIKNNYLLFLIIMIIFVLVVNLFVTLISPPYRLTKIKEAFKLINITTLIVGYFSFAFVPVIYQNFIEGKEIIDHVIAVQEEKAPLKEEEMELKKVYMNEVSSFTEDDINSSLILLLVPYSLSFIICVYVIDYREGKNKLALKNYKKDLDEIFLSDYVIIEEALFLYDTYLYYEEDKDEISKYLKKIMLVTEETNVDEDID